MGARLTRLGRTFSRTKYSEETVERLDAAMQEILLDINREMGPDEVELLKSKPICKNIMEAATRNLQLGLEMGNSEMSSSEATQLAKEVVLRKAFALKLYDTVRSAIGADPGFIKLQEEKGLSNAAIDSKSMCQDRINALAMSNFRDENGNYVFTNMICGRGHMHTKKQDLSVTSYDEISNIIDLFSIAECANPSKPLGNIVDKDKQIRSLGIDMQNTRRRTPRSVENERVELGRRTVTRTESTHPLCAVYPDPYEVGEEVIKRNRESGKFKIVKRHVSSTEVDGSPLYVYDIKGRTYEYKNVPQTDLLPSVKMTVPFACFETNSVMQEGQRPTAWGVTFAGIHQAVERSRKAMVNAQFVAAAKLVPILNKYFPEARETDTKLSTEKLPGLEVKEGGQELQDDKEKTSDSELNQDDNIRKVDSSNFVGGDSDSMSTNSPHVDSRLANKLVQGGGLRNRNKEITIAQMKNDAIQVRNAVVKLLVTCDREYAKALEELRLLQKLSGFYGEAKYKIKEEYKKMRENVANRRDWYGEMQVSANDVYKTFSRAEDSYRKNSGMEVACQDQKRYDNKYNYTEKENKLRAKPDYRFKPYDKPGRAESSREYANRHDYLQDKVHPELLRLRKRAH